MTTLITGSDGYVGSRLAARLLATTDDELLLTVRAADAAELDAKRQRLGAYLGTADDDTRVSILPVDLGREGAFDAVDPARVRTIVHTAAITRFNVEEDLAQRVNIDGAERVRDFALRAGQLDRIVTTSTLYAAGRHEGAVGEAQLVDRTFVNFYEWSKWHAEQVLEQAGLPLTVARLPTVIAEDDTGVVVQQNAFHNTMRLYYYGLLTLLPGNPQTPLFLSTVEFTVAALQQLLDPEVPLGIYHIAADRDQTATFGEIVDTAFEVFERDPGFRRRRLPRPYVCDLESFRDMVAVAEQLKGGPINQAVGSVAPFAEQLYLPKYFRNDALRAVWPEYRAPEPAKLIEAICSYLVETRWGRKADTREQGAGLVGATREHRGSTHDDVS